MSERSSGFIEMVQACQAAIIRVRASTCSGNSDTSKVGDDLEFICRAVAPYFARFAKGVERLAPGADEEAQQIMVDRLLDHISSPTYPTLATRFGAYLKCTRQHAFKKTRQIYVPPGQDQPISRLDANPNNNGYKFSEAIADPRAEAAFTSVIDRIALQDAIAQLSGDERQVVVLLMAGYTNNEVAQQLGISPSTATRIRQRAAAQLQQSLDYTDK